MSRRRSIMETWADSTRPCTGELYTIQCIVYSVHCTLYTVHCMFTVHTVHFTPYTVHCTGSSRPCTLHTAQVGGRKTRRGSPVGISPPPCKPHPLVKFTQSPHTHFTKLQLPTPRCNSVDMGPVQSSSYVSLNHNADYRPAAATPGLLDHEMCGHLVSFLHVARVQVWRGREDASEGHTDQGVPAGSGGLRGGYLYYSGCS